MTDGTSIGPTPERLARARREGAVVTETFVVLGTIRPSALQYQDSDGRPGNPYTVPDSLNTLKQNGKIGSIEVQAGGMFRDDFARAGHEPLRASTLELRSPGVHVFSDGRVDARQRVYGAMRTLGGMGSPAGSCAWHVLGMDWPVRKWAIERRMVHERAAHAVLMATLGVLVGYYGLRDNERAG